MSSSSSANPADPTFRRYSEAQAKLYAAGRDAPYDPFLYNYVIERHTSTGGRLGTLLDVGCGPGNATKDMALFFDHVTGCDPGEEMIALARRGGFKSQSGEDIKFVVCPAEDLTSLAKDGEVGVKEGEVDLIICAMSAHWFDLKRFYSEAACILRPGGTIAMWTCGSIFVHPQETPNAAAVQAVFNELEHVTLKPYTTQGNMYSYQVYDTLPLPWDMNSPKLEELFRRESLHRITWNKNGQIPDGFNGSFAAQMALSLSFAKKMLGTTSMVTRWREAHPDLVGTPGDCVEKAMRNVKEALGTTEDDAKVTIPVGIACGLLVLKRKA